MPPESRNAPQQQPNRVVRQRGEQLASAQGAEADQQQAGAQCNIGVRQLGGNPAPDGQGENAEGQRLLYVRACRSSGNAMDAAKMSSGHTMTVIRCAVLGVFPAGAAAGFEGRGSAWSLLMPIGVPSQEAAGPAWHWRWRTGRMERLVPYGGKPRDHAVRLAGQLCGRKPSTPLVVAPVSGRNS